MNKPSILEELKASMPEVFKFAKSLPASESEFYMSFLLHNILKDMNDKKLNNAEGGSK